MALENGNGSDMVMPVQPMGYGGNYGGNWGGFGVPYAVPVMGGFGGGYGNGGFGGDWSGLLVLFLFAAMFGGFGGGWGMGGFGGFGDGMFPWLMTGQAGINANTNDGFNNAGLASQISGLRSDVTGGFSDVQLGIAGVNQNICQTGAGITAAVTNGFAQAEIADNARQIANMQQAFNAQTATTGAIHGVSDQLANCCCEQRLATANLQSVIQSENCADREAINNGIRDLLTATTAQNQRILDKLCDQELQAERRENDNLRTQLNMANLAASQTAQTSRLLADNAAQTQQIENYVRPQINPAYIVPNPYAYNFYPGNGWNGGWNGGCCNGGNFGGFNGNF